jgi:phage-related protein
MMRRDTAESATKGDDNMASTMPLTINPTFDRTSKAARPRRLEANFGNGYRQRAGDGLNPVELELNLGWVGSNTNIDELLTHFEERAGYQSFTIEDALIADDVTYKWTCDDWSYKHISDTIMTLDAILRKENDLV